MINLKESTLVNEAIKHLGYKTSKYIYTLFFNFISRTNFQLQWILWFIRFIKQHVIVSCNVLEN